MCAMGFRGSIGLGCMIEATFVDVESELLSDAHNL